MYRDRSEYEAMTAEELDAQFTEHELRQILKEVFEWDSDAYYCQKDDKIRWITNPDARSEIEARIEPKRSEQRSRENEQRRARKQVVDHAREGQYRFEGNIRVKQSFTDQLTGVTETDACVIRDTLDGKQLKVSMGTATDLYRAERLSGLDRKRFLAPDSFDDFDPA